MCIETLKLKGNIYMNVNAKIFYKLAKIFRLSALYRFIIFVRTFLQNWQL